MPFDPNSAFNPREELKFDPLSPAREKVAVNDPAIPQNVLEDWRSTLDSLMDADNLTFAQEEAVRSLSDEIYSYLRG